MDDYPAGDPIPDPSVFEGQYHELVDFLTNSREMRKTARSSFKQAAFAGGGAMAGGFMLGPPGGLIGGIVGSVVGYLQADNYDGVMLALAKLDGDERKVLMQRVGQVLVAAGATAQQLDSRTVFRNTLFQYASQPSFREHLWNACAESLKG